MTAPPADGVHTARAHLARGGAVVLPNAAPLTYVVAATTPYAVNRAKGRPDGQPVALWTHHPHTTDLVLRALDLSPRAAGTARRLLSDERVTLLVPLLREHTPPNWLAPACHEGWTLLFGARWGPLRSVLDAHPVLYVSSANRTGHPPAATAARARAVFPDDVPVLDAVALPGTTPDAADAPPRAATTTIRMHPDGRVEAHRSGAQDRPYADVAAYVDHLRTAYGPSR
ncbi:hypothetical protein [Streptomyces sp. NPDC057939]|uniref:hypothetical protein n=1 Tax=Streptomyces sp. NPDC057939 TaxID=3346284 RepID=UPI0036E6897A